MRYFNFFIACLFSLNLFAQSYSFQIELVDFSVGQSLTSPPDFYSNESNDAGLNQIFQDHNVIEYERIYPDNIPDSYVPQGGNFNIAVCGSCDAQAFLDDVNNYSSVIVAQSVAFDIFLFALSLNENRLDSVEIYPNPFSNKIAIKTNSQLVAIELFDILGKQVIKTDSKSAFESLAPLLKQGVYILKLTDIDDKTITKKLIKQ